MMSSSRFRKAGRGSGRFARRGDPGLTKSGSKKEMKSFQAHLDDRDFQGAVTLLELETAAEESKVTNGDEWLAYAAFHLGNHELAERQYAELADKGDNPRYHLAHASCLYYLQRYNEAAEAAKKGPECELRNRLLFHLAHKTNDETSLMLHHQKLTASTLDQLSLAAIHYLRGHFQEATDIYKRLLLENRDNVALNVYIAMSYYKLDYYDVSLEILAVYLQAFPDSIVATNLKACNHFKLYNGKAAEAELKPLLDQGVNTSHHDLLSHNLVVFRNGEGALQVLPPLVDILPEARMNLVVYYLKHDEVAEAEALVKDLEPSTPPEYILKGVVHAMMGQQTGSREHLKMAQQFFQLVGSSASECDTIPGRQCMASCFFLLRQFDDVLIYCRSIKAYLYGEDDFLWNFGIALASKGEFKEAQETLQQIQRESLRSDYCFVSWLARCYIMNKQAKSAWELYLKMDTSNESFNLLQLIANDCYKMGAFYYAAKAFDVLERLDPDPEYWEGKRGASVGVFQQVIAKQANVDVLRDVVAMLRNTMNPQVEYLIRVMHKWMSEAYGQ